MIRHWSSNVWQGNLVAPKLIYSLSTKVSSTFLWEFSPITQNVYSMTSEQVQWRFESDRGQSRIRFDGFGIHCVEYRWPRNTDEKQGEHRRKSMKQGKWSNIHPIGWKSQCWSLKMIASMQWDDLQFKWGFNLTAVSSSLRKPIVFFAQMDLGNF